MRTIYTRSVIDRATEDKLWESGVIVFDTSALLNFYYMTPDFQRVMSDILHFLSGRIWVPLQVIWEFEKNRENTMRKPKTEKYQDNDIQNNHLVADIQGLIEQWEEQYYHPYIAKDKLDSIKTYLAIIKSEVEKIKKLLAFEYQARRKEIEDIIDDDKIVEAVRSLSHGDAFTYSEIKSIMNEGSIRYANQAAPGYADADGKKGVHKYGDFIIWKEMLRHAKQMHRDLIFVTNDVKADWLILEDKKKGDCDGYYTKEEIGHPKRELLAEFEEETGQQIWFYKTSDFIGKIEDLYKPESGGMEFYGKLGLVRDALFRAERDRRIHDDKSTESLLIRCDTCHQLFEVYANELSYDWTAEVEDADRGMGEEWLHESYETCECPHCESQIDIKLQIWEYPLGIMNLQNIEVDGGTLEESIDLSDYKPFDDYEECERCGQRAILNEYHLCPACEAEFEEFMNED